MERKDFDEPAYTYMVHSRLYFFLSSLFSPHLSTTQEKISKSSPFFSFYFLFNRAKGTFLQLLFYRPILISCMLLHFLSFNFCYPHVAIFFMQTTANALHLLPHNLKSMLCLLRPFPLYQSGWAITLVMNVVYSS